MSETVLPNGAPKFLLTFLPTPAQDDGSDAQRSDFIGDGMDTFSEVVCSDYVETKAVDVSGPGCQAVET